MSEEIEKVRKELEAVLEEIQKVQHEIEKVEAKIESAEHKLNEHGMSAEDNKYWRDKENKLLDEKNKLLDEKNKLRDEKNMLLDEAKELKRELKDLRAGSGRPPLHPQTSISDGVEIAKQALESLLITHRIIDCRGRPQRTLSYVSKSHAFSSMIADQRISFAEDFFFDLVEPVSTDAFAGNGPDSSQDENKIHHPYFLGEMRKLIKSALEDGRTIRQQLLWSKAGHWLKLDDGISFGVEPDFCTIEHNSGEQWIASSTRSTTPQSKYDVTMAFEQKKQFVDTDQMDIIDYGERLLCVQRGRPLVYTALFHCSCDEKTIRWAETREIDGQFISKISKPASLLPGCDGQRQILTMLSKSSQDLGLEYPRLQPIDGKNVRILYLVGEGFTSKVYAAEVGQVRGVVKVMKRGFEGLADHEKMVLNHLNERGVSGLPKCYKAGRGVIFLDALLRPFTGTFSIDNVAQIVDHLEAVHRAGVVHRDFRPENIMEDVVGQLHLIDWGFALVKDPIDGFKSAHFAGTFRYGSEAVVSAAIERRQYRYMPADDLVSLVKTVLAVNSGGQRLLRRVSEIPSGEYLAALDLWADERENLGSMVSRMFDAALQEDYATLKKVLVY